MYVALEPRSVTICSNDGNLMTLTYFTEKSNWSPMLLYGDMRLNGHGGLSDFCQHQKFCTSGLLLLNVFSAL